MFFTYLRRELRRRMRQAVLIASGLAVGIGLVITVTALSAGVRNAQGTVLHSLYGVGTDVTVTRAPAARVGGPRSFGFGGATGTRTRPAAGTKIDIDTLSNFGLGTLSSSSVTAISRLHNVAGAAGGLTLTDTRITGKIPAINTGGGFGGGGGGGGRFRGAFTPKSFTVSGVDLSQGELGPLSSGKVAAGRTFTAADASANVAVVDSDYAKQDKLKVGSSVTIAKQSFQVVGIVSEPAGASAADAYIPLARAQALASMKNKVNTVYVAAGSASAIGAVAKEISALLPKATVTDSSDLAGTVTGSLASTSSLANNLGRWLAIAVLAAAFLLASLLTMAAVGRRVREFGTLKALGWREPAGDQTGDGRVGRDRRDRRHCRRRPRISRRHAGVPAVPAAVGVDRPDDRQCHARRRARVRRWELRWRRAGGNFGGGGFGGGFRRFAADASHTVTVHLTAPVTLGIIAAAVALALAGGLIAGMFGGWRAARLRPADALARVE